MKSNLNTVFKKIYTHPSLIWKAGASLLFAVFAIVILFSPSLTGLSDNGRIAFSCLLFFYAFYRFMTFYAEYKNYGAE